MLKLLRAVNGNIDDIILKSIVKNGACGQALVYVSSLMFLFKRFFLKSIVTKVATLYKSGIGYVLS